MWRWVVYVLMVLSITREHSLQSRGKCVGGEQTPSAPWSQSITWDQTKPRQGFLRRMRGAAAVQVWHKHCCCSSAGARGDMNST